MSWFVDAAHNSMLEQVRAKITTAGLSLHTAWSATGANEVTGGTPAYARKTAAWNAAANGDLDLSADVTFDVPATTVRFLGLWTNDATPIFWGMVPLLGSGLGNTPQLFAVNDIATDLLVVPGHGLANDQNVVVTDAAGETLPAGLVAGTVYFVVTATTDTLKLSATQGGAAVDITATGVGIIQRITPETFAAQGTYTAKAGTRVSI